MSKVSVVIPTKNRSALLAEAIERIECQSVPREQYEVIVIDNDSTDDTRSVLLGSSGSHRDGLSVTGVNTFQFVDDMQHIVAASLFAVGDDVDACAVLVFDRLQRGLIQQSCKFACPEFCLAPVESKTKAVEQRSAVLPVDIARLRIAADNCG